jgi:hypothetical protein
MREEMENIANEPESALPLPVINKSNQQQQDIQISSLSQNSKYYLNLFASSKQNE